MAIDSAPRSETPWASPQEEYLRASQLKGIQRGEEGLSAFESSEALFAALAKPLEILEKVTKILALPVTGMKKAGGYVGDAFKDLLRL